MNTPKIIRSLRENYPDCLLADGSDDRCKRPVRFGVLGQPLLRDSGRRARREDSQ
jgi:hypothetical protein